MKKELVKAYIPQSWKDVSLKRYITYRKNLELIKDEPDFDINALLVALDSLCGIEPQWVDSLEMSELKRIQMDLVSFMKETNLPLQRIIDVGGILYGFEPNLSVMPYGMYLDLTKYDTITIDDNWAKIMSILYRPLVGDKPKSADDKYTIREYDGKLYPELFEYITMDVHFGALFFFIHLQKDLLRSTLKHLKEEEGMEELLPIILGRNGEAILRWLNSQTEISQSSMK